MGDKRRFNMPVILLAILYLVIGLADLIGGSDPSTRFYKFDNVLIRFIGLILIISSIGILFKKEIGRKGITFALNLSIIEIAIGVPKEINTLEFIAGIIIMLIVYLPGLIYFSITKNKEYFN